MRDAEERLSEAVEFREKVVAFEKIQTALNQRLGSLIYPSLEEVKK